MIKIFIKPGPGRKVINPATGGFLPECGARVEKTQYWSRRIGQGGAVLSVDKTEAGLTPGNRAPEKAEPIVEQAAPALPISEEQPAPAPETKKVVKKKKKIKFNLEDQK